MSETQSAYPESLAIREATANSQKKNTELYVPQKLSGETQALIQQDARKNQNDAAALIRALDNGIISNNTLTNQAKGAEFVVDLSSVKFGGKEYKSIPDGISGIKDTGADLYAGGRRIRVTPSKLFKSADGEYLKAYGKDDGGRFALSEKSISTIGIVDKINAEKMLGENRKARENKEGLELGKIARSINPNFMGEASSYIPTKYTHTRKEVPGSMIFNDNKGNRLQVFTNGATKQVSGKTT